MNSPVLEIIFGLLAFAYLHFLMDAPGWAAVIGAWVFVLLARKR